MHDDLLLLVHGRDMFSQPEMADERNYYKPQGRLARRACDAGARGTGRPAWRSTTFPKPAEPRQIGFMPVEGTGIHRIWYVGGRWAYASAMIEGFSDYIFITIDMKDPTKPRDRRALLAAGDESRGRREGQLAARAGRYGLHHAVVHDDIAYGAWRDACLACVDVKDKANPKLIVHKPGRRRSAAARTIACRFPTATC